MRFLIPRRDSLPAGAVARAYLAGRDDVPWRARVVGTPEGLIVDRAENDSGSFHIPWRVNGREWMLATASLMERSRPYQLDIELARGTLNRLRNQTALWQQAGMVITPEVTAGIAQGSHAFSEAATHQHEPATAADFAQQAIEHGLRSIERLTSSYNEQSLAARRRQSPRLTTLWGGHLGQTLPNENTATAFLAAFNTALVPLTWRTVESREGKQDWSIFDGQVAWCQAHGLKIFGGPVMRWDKGALPDWLYLWEDDFDNLLSMATEYVQAAVTRYRGRINIWQCAARLNAGDVLSLTDEHRLRLAVRSIEVTRAADAKTPIILWVDQPWGEYMAHHDMEVSPLHFADALVRADLGLSGIGLEINLGYQPAETYPRDLLEVSRQIDRWSYLGLPLVIVLSLNGTDLKWSEPANAAWLDQLVQMLLAKQPVQAILWHPAAAAGPSDFPPADPFAPPPMAHALLEKLGGIRRNLLG